MSKQNILKEEDEFNMTLPKQPKNKERTMVMLELKTDKQDYYGKHINKTIAFLRSLGFEVELEHEGRDEDLIINGHKVRGDFKHASSMALGAYTHKWAERKKRQVTLEWAWRDPFCTIPINKEIDKLKFINKIMLAFKERDELTAKMAKSDEDKIKTITALYERYNAVTGFKSIAIQKGELRISTNSGDLGFTPDGVVIRFSINFPKFETLDDLHSFPDKALEIKNSIFKAKDEIEKLGATGVTKETRDASAYRNEEGELKIY